MQKSASNNSETAVKTSNFYEDENSSPEQELNEPHLDMKGQKRSREQVSPKTKKPDISKKRILTLKRQTSSKENQIEEVSPSPVFQSKFKNISKSREMQNSNCKCQQCIQNGNTSRLATHHERCGCHSCFSENCNENKPLTKDKLRNLIRNFLSRKDNITSDLQSHRKDCMCVNHLLYYRENRISVLDQFLDKHKNENENKTSVSSKQNSEKSNNSEISVKSKLTSSAN